MRYLWEIFNTPFTSLQFDQQLLLVLFVIGGVLLVVGAFSYVTRHIEKRRAHPRRPLQGPVEVSWETEPGSTWQGLGRCVDVSAGGLRLELRDPIPVGTPITFSVLDRNMRGTALVRHCNFIGLRNVIGVQFNEVSAWDKKVAVPKRGWLF